jgi:hypothetical protein
MRRDHSSLSLHNMGASSSSVGKHLLPLPSSSASGTVSHAAIPAATWGRGDAAAAAAAIAPSPPRSPQASPLATTVGSVEKHNVGSLEKFIERQLMKPRTSLHMKGAMSHADLSSLSKQPPTMMIPRRVHVPLIINDMTAEQFIDVEHHDVRRSSGSDAPVSHPPHAKISENSLGYGRGDAVAVAAAAVAAAAATPASGATASAVDGTSQPLTSYVRNSPKLVSGGCGSDVASSSSNSALKHVSLNLDLICEPSILPLTCSLWPDPALLERNYKEIPSSRTSFIPAYENNISTLMSELICQRLAGDFQLLADAGAKVDKNK